MRFFICVCAVILLMTGTQMSNAQEKKVEPPKFPPLEGSKWNIEIQIEAKKFGTGEFSFTKTSRDGAVEGTFKAPVLEAGTWKGTLKEGFLKAEMTQGKDTWEIEGAIARQADGQLIQPGRLQWRKKGAKDWLQFNLLSQAFVPKDAPKDRLPLPDLAKAMGVKKFTLIDQNGKPGGTIQFKLDGAKAEVRVTNLAGKETVHAGVVQGTLLAVALQKAGQLDLFVVFCQDDGKWRGYGLFGGKDTPIKERVILEEEKK